MLSYCQIFYVKYTLFMDAGKKETKQFILKLCKDVQQSATCILGLNKIILIFENGVF